jgi:fructan beta-fructosidase
MGVEFYGSTDLKSWQHLSTFHTALKGRPSLQWECPDLIQIGSKWVLLVSVNPGGPLVGSGMMYFTGQFDGNTFTADEREYPLWLDYGMDNYAGVTWSNTPNRHIMIGWMNNWSYAGAVPCSPWRSAFTLPRELTLTDYKGSTLLCSTVVPEIDRIAEAWSKPHFVSASGEAINAKSAYQLRLTIALDRSTSVTLSNDADEAFAFDISASARILTAHRTAKSGKTSFNGTFSLPSMNAPLCVEGNKVTLDIFVDQSSVEIFTQQGTMSMTNLVFPQSIYNRLTVEGADCEAQVRELRRIWN